MRKIFYRGREVDQHLIKSVRGSTIYVHQSETFFQISSDYLYKLEKEYGFTIERDKKKKESALNTDTFNTRDLLFVLVEIGDAENALNLLHSLATGNMIPETEAMEVLRGFESLNIERMIDAVFELHKDELIPQILGKPDLEELMNFREAEYRQANPTNPDGLRPELKKYYLNLVPQIFSVLALNSTGISNLLRKSNLNWRNIFDVIKNPEQIEALSVKKASEFIEYIQTKEDMVNSDVLDIGYNPEAQRYLKFKDAMDIFRWSFSTLITRFFDGAINIEFFNGSPFVVADSKAKKNRHMPKYRMPEIINLIEQESIYLNENTKVAQDLNEQYLTFVAAAECISSGYNDRGYNRKVSPKTLLFRVIQGRIGVKWIDGTPYLFKDGVEYYRDNIYKKKKI